MKISMSRYFLLMFSVGFLCSTVSGYSQLSEKVLFIGNSYTGVNNLPNLTAQVALSAGDTLTFSAHHPGGQTLSAHSTNANALGLIAQGNWDHVILQGQSQEPSFPIGQVQTQTLPFAELLCDSIRAANPCTRPMFFMTWGRENGDASNCASWPPVCTYEGMDDLLRERYLLMAEMNEAYVSPVGAVWRHLRDSGTSISLYASDGSHPSLAGSYAAACAFYSMIFEKDPLLISNDFGLSAADALEIRQAAHEIVFQNLSDWGVGNYNPTALFSVNQGSGFNYTFINQSTYADSIIWNGNVTSQNQDTLVITFPGPGTYPITLEATSCGMTDSLTLQIEISINPSSVDDLEQRVVSIHPNPVHDILRINSAQRISFIEVTDITGKILIRTAEIERNELDVSGLTTGRYTVSIITDTGQVHSLNFIKE
jgi:hypothetical protein